jgi:hypothetical protein
VHYLKLPAVVQQLDFGRSDCSRCRFIRRIHSVVDRRMFGENICPPSYCTADRERKTTDSRASSAATFTTTAAITSTATSAVASSTKSVTTTDTRTAASATAHTNLYKSIYFLFLKISINFNLISNK